MNDDFFNQINDTSDSKTGKNVNKSHSNKKNKIANIIKVTSWIIFIGCVIAGIIIACEDDIVIALFPLIGGIINLIFCLGFAELIQLLQDIKNKIK